MYINRRKFIQTAAIAAGGVVLPRTSAFAESSAKGGIPHRFIFIRFCNGQRPKEMVLPNLSDKDMAKDAAKQAFEADLTNHELQPWMYALDPYKKHMTILQGMSAMMNTNGHGGSQSVMGCFKCDGKLSMIKRATVDFELSRLFPSPFGHVELSLVGAGDNHFRKGIGEGFAAPAPFQKNYCYCDPETALNELFKSVTDPAVADRENKRLLFLHDQEMARAGNLVGFEKLKLTSLVDSLDAIQQRNKLVAEKAELIKRYLPKLAKVHENGGENATSIQKLDAMTDILVASLATGLTNVVLYSMDNLATPMLGLEGNEADRIGLHAVGHNVGYSGVSSDAIREKIRILYLKQIATIVERLKAIPEGKGSMFDNTTILYFPENGETHHGNGSESPWIVFSGDNSRLKNMAGHYIRVPFHGTEGHKTLGNWYTTLLNAYGNPIKHYGDLDLEMSRLKLPQTGSIQRFMA